MLIKTQPRCRFNKGRFHLALITGGLVLFAVACGAASMGYEPSLVFGVAAVVALLPVLICRIPVALIVGLTFVGLLKTSAAEGFSVTDPTFVILALLYAAVAVRVLQASTGAEGHSLRDLFRGQLVGVSAFFLLIIVIAISYTYTPAPGLGWDKVVRLIVLDSLAFVAPLISLQNDRDVDQLVFFTTLVSLVLTVRIVYPLLHPTAEVLLGDEDVTQIGPGLALVVTTLMLLYYPVKAGRSRRLEVKICLLVLVWGVVASVSRSAILSLLAGATLGSVFLKIDSKIVSRRAILLTMAASVLVAFVAFQWLRQLPAASFKLTAKLQELSADLQGSTAAGTIYRRYELSGSAWQAFLSKPLLGWGAGGWSTLLHYSDEHFTYPHNFVLEIAAEQGFIGLVPLGILLLAIIRASARILKARSSQLSFVVPVVLLTLIGNCFTGQVESRGVWCWCGILFAFARMTQSQCCPRPFDSLRS
jgi:O-antigen ligase